MSVVWVGLTGVTIAVLGLVTWQSRETLLVALRTARYGRLAWTFVAYTASIGAIAVGWHLVMRHLGGERRFAVNAKIYVSTLAARRLPGTLWYIAGRAVLYRRLGTPVRLCSIASGIEVILSIVSGLMVGAPALLSRAEASPFQVAIGVVIELAGLCLLHPKVLRWLLARSGHFVEPGELTVLRVGSWIVAYVAMWISGGLMAYSVVSALYPVSLSAMPLTVSLWSLTGVISYLAFLLPSNLGLSEITLSLLLSRIFPLPITVTAAILIRVLTTAVDIVWSSLLLYEMKRHPDLFQPG
ncbi:MAG: hypothetical protein ISS56_10765 [Anaerolineae bacterium]|nr:hypothetical protein [Anaerolineae bacterium]